MAPAASGSRVVVFRVRHLAIDWNCEEIDAVWNPLLGFSITAPDLQGLEQQEIYVY